MVEHGPQCQSNIWGGYRSHQCSRRGVVKEEDKFWCRQHAPAAVQKREEKRDRKHKEYRTTEDHRWAIKHAKETVATMAIGYFHDENTLEALQKAVKEYDRLAAGKQED